jgi:nitrate/nitrite transport system substrate-binding protein
MNPNLEEKKSSAEHRIVELIESALLHGIFGGRTASRREFFKLVGVTSALAIIEEVVPLSALKAWAADSTGKPERTELKVGFIPITCATPLIMAEPLGFYKKYGLNVEVLKASGWAMIRDLALNKQTDATHMLTPMPLAISMGIGSQSAPFVMPAIENVNGQAITLHTKHKGVQTVKEMKGFKFAVPFDYSMHNFLLRYVLAEGGLDPDKDVQIRVLPPPEMVANLRANNLDGYLGPDPFNQRAVFEGFGFIYMLSKDIWDGHPCCAFACSKEFSTSSPNSFKALLKAIIDSTEHAANKANRKEIAKAIAPKNYLNQPEEVLEQVLTGVFPDGRGNTRTVPERIDFDPYPWHSMAIWILTQMKRWGYVKGDVNYKKIAEEVYLTSSCREVMQSMGHKAPQETMKKHRFADGKVFDPERPEEYIQSFAIRRV